MFIGQVQLRDGKIIVEVKVKDLKAFLESGPLGVDIEIVDAKKLAKDVVRAMNWEDPDDGTTRFQTFLERSIETAWEDGSEGVREIPLDEER